MHFSPVRFFCKPWIGVLFYTLLLTTLLLPGSFSLAGATEKALTEPQTLNDPSLAQPAPPLSDPQLIAPDIREILKRGSLVVAVLSRDNRPFVMSSDNAEYSGLSIDLLKGFAESIGVKTTYNNNAKTFNELIELVVRGQADVAACGVSRTIRRAMYVNFSTPYLKLHQGLLINRLKLSQQTHGHSWKDVIKGLRGRLGVLADSSYIKFSHEHLDSMEIVTFPHVREAKEAVVNGTITAAHLDELDIKMLIRNHPEQALRCQTVIFKDIPDHLAVPVSRKNPQLLKLLNIYIEEHPIDLTIDQILDRYLPAISIKK